MQVQDGQAETQKAQVERAIVAAHRHFSAGRLAEAEGLTRKALQASPDHPEALHLLGVIACAVGRAAAGLPLIESAAAGRPDDARILFSRANALKALDRLDEAVAGYEDVLELKPDFAEAAFNLGLALESRLDTEAACQVYQQAVTTNPKLFQGHVNLGNLLQRLYRFEEAVAAYEQAIALRPDLAEAHSNLGNALFSLRRPEAALGAMERAVALNPNFAVGHHNLGKVLARLDRREKAAAAYRRAIEIDPGMVEAQADLGHLLWSLGRLEEAAATLGRAVKQDPDHGQAAINLGAVLMVQGKPEAALALCEETLARAPCDTSMLALQATVLLELGDRAAFDRLLDFDRLLTTTIFTAPPQGFASLEEFNGALAQHVMSHPSLTYEPPTNTTKGGWHTGSLLSGDKGPVAALEQTIGEAVDAYLAGHPADPGHPFLANKPAGWRLTIWSIVMEVGGYQVPHIHSSWLSGVYYVQLPEDIGCEADKKAGWIEFGRPAPRFPIKAEPVVREVEPVPGLLVLFPSYFYHRTVPFTAAGRRISIAFDVLPE